MRIEPPKIDGREFSALFKLLKTLIPHYTPEWKGSDENDPGVALLKIFSHMTESVIHRLNQVPLKNLVAFLDMLGIKRLPAQPAMAPVTFKLAKGTDKEIFVPERTQAAADKTEEHEEIPFETENNLLLTVSNLKEVISADPFKDNIYVHTPNVVSDDGSIRDRQEAFVLFSGNDQQEHTLYMGHKDLFNIKSKGRIAVEVTFAAGSEAGNSSLNLIWEYWGENKEENKTDWISLQVLDDETEALRQSGKIVLYKSVEGEIKEEKLSDIFKKTSRVEIKDKTIGEKKTRWIRVRLKDALVLGFTQRLPLVDTIYIKTAPTEPVPPEAGSFNDVPVDWTEVTKNDVVMKNIVVQRPEKAGKVFPFGIQPRLYDSFYIGSQEAFSKKGAMITLFFSLALLDTSNGVTPAPDPRLSWEYWDGKGWQALTIDKDQTDRFLNEGREKTVEFYCPDDIAETEVNGKKNYWIRTRITGGDYGREEYTIVESNVTTGSGTTKSTKTIVERKYKLPIVRGLSIGYYFDKGETLQQCLSYNNLDFQDSRTASMTEGQFLRPFIPMADEHFNIYLGFDRPLMSGPIRIFFAARELPYTDEDKPKVEWNYRTWNEWALLDYLDETEGFIAQGNLELIGPSEFSELPLFGRSLYWLQGSLVQGVYESQPELQGIYPNTTWAIQAETIKDEILGSGNGEANQAFSFLKFPVLDGEEIRVREILSEEEKQDLIDQIGKNALYEVKDEKGKVIETWVLWSEVPDFFDSSEKSRHYTIDRATGQLQFGDGVSGMIPLAGDNNIKVFAYQTGGGAQGNVMAGEIKTLKTAVPGVDKVSNPVAADGGSDAATLDQMIDIGPAMISHRNRAVTIEDFEWLARQAARKVAKVRCLSNINREGKREIGWVTVIIVPDDKTPEPKPSFELKKIVRQYLEAHCTNTLSNVKHIHVDGPSYTEISVSVDVFVTSIDEASQVEREVMRKLDAFFHPLTGGPEEIGWDFGRDVSASDIYTLLEDIEGVDHVENLKFRDNGMTYKETVEIGQDFLVANGKHTINIQLKKELET